MSAPPVRRGAETTEVAAKAGVPAPEIAPPAPFHAVRTLRWLLVAPAGVLGWFAGDWAGLALTALARGFCATAETSAAGCQAGWYDTAAMLAALAGTALGAGLAVLLPTLTAPSFRGTVAWTAYGFAAAAAGNLAWLDGAWLAMLVAVVTGFAVLWLALRRWRGDGRARPRRRSASP